MNQRCNRRRVIEHYTFGTVLVGLLALAVAWTPAVAAPGKGGTLRIGMTAADIAYTAGQPDQGFEGFRFVGYQFVRRPGALGSVPR